MENKNSHIDKLKNNFSTPENYFNEFEDRLISLSKLEGIEKKNNFNIPEGYFEKLNVTSPTQEEQKVIPFTQTKTYRLIRYSVAIAAIFILAFFIYNPTNENVENTPKIAITTEVLHEDLDNYTSSFEEDNLIAFLDFDEAIDEKDTYFFNKEIDVVTTSDDIDDYLSSDYEFDVDF